MKGLNKSTTVQQAVMTVFKENLNSLGGQKATKYSKDNMRRRERGSYCTFGLFCKKDRERGSIFLSYKMVTALFMLLLPQL